MTTTTHNPCCSSHGVDMDCAKYRRTHFVKVGNCCDAWARQHPTMPIPDEAAEAFRRVKTEWACEPLASDHYALEAAAPLIVAARLEQLADEIWQEHGADNETDADYVTGVDDAVVMMRAEVRRLRGEQS